MNPMYAVMKGTAMKDKKKRAGGGGGGGGGGTPTVSVATSATGNFDNAIKLAFINPASNDFSYSAGVKDGSNSVFGTASGPTRTTQMIPISVADYVNAYNNNGSGGADIIIGGYIRTANITPNHYQWYVDANAIISQSFTTATLISNETTVNRMSTQDNTNISVGGPFGIYDTPLTSSNGSGYYVLSIRHGGGRGAATLPQVGDTFTFRVVGQAVQGKSMYNAIHDVTVNFV